MSAETGEGTPSVSELDEMSTQDLRERAFAKAEHAHDIGFFWDLIKHLRASEDFNTDDGSAGGLGGSITGAIELVEEALGRHDGSLDPLLRARFIDYIRTP